VLSARPDANNGESVKLQVDGSPTARSYLRFDVQGLVDPVVNATLYVIATSGSSTGYQVGGVSDNSWTESGLTYSNAPAVGAPVGSSGAFARNSWTAVDVTALVSGTGTVNLATMGFSATGVAFGSEEGVNSPLLVVTTSVSGLANPTPTPAPTITPGPAIDSDGDGLSDADELLNGTDVNKPDTDGDTMPDLWEVETGLNPLSATGEDGAQGDPDDDGVTNLDEFGWQTDPWEVDNPGSERLFLPLVER
jgi:hypothetical protein